MYGAIRVVVADPTAEVLDGAGGRWVVSAARPDAIEAVVRDAESATEVRNRIGDVAEDATVVHVATDASGLAHVDVYRSVIATRSLYLLEAPAGTLVVTDNFRNAAATLPVSERTVADAAVADHLLFRTRVPPASYLEGISQVRHGRWRRWDADSDTWTTTRTAGLTGGQPPQSPRNAIARALDTHIEHAGATTATNMLSGGVDSTLLQTFVGDDALFVDHEPPEMSHERDYATEAAGLLGVEPETVSFPEDRFLHRLESSMDHLGYPSHFSLTPVFDDLFGRLDTGCFLNGEGQTRCSAWTESPASERRRRSTRR
ncbi:hypothetical protein VB773_13165 [Haloarculaceae archaeon H-GB2-1]|nr:hypothetical protein [Haloarculaceae archaeon H-GB2-1]